MKPKNIYLSLLIALIAIGHFACGAASSGESEESGGGEAMSGVSTPPGVPQFDVPLIEVRPIEVPPIPEQNSPQIQIREYRPRIMSPQKNDLAMEPVYGKFQTEAYPGPAIHYATDWEVFDGVTGELVWQSSYNLTQLTSIHIHEGTFTQPSEQEEMDPFLENGSYSLRVRFYEIQGEDILESQWSDPVIFQTGDPLPPIWALGQSNDSNLDSSRSQLPGGILGQPPSFGVQGWEFIGGGLIFADFYGTLAARNGLTLTLRLEIHAIQEGTVTLLSRSSASVCSYQITLIHGIPHFHLCADGQNENEVVLAAPHALTPGQEHTVTAIFDGIDMILYIDRQRVAITDTFSNQDIFNSETNLTVGIAEDGQSQAFYGYLVGASIFRRALSEIY